MPARHADHPADSRDVLQGKQEKHQLHGALGGGIKIAKILLHDVEQSSRALDLVVLPRILPRNHEVREEHLSDCFVDWHVCVTLADQFVELLLEDVIDSLMA